MYTFMLTDMYHAAKLEIKNGEIWQTRLVLNLDNINGDRSDQADQDVEFIHSLLLKSYPTSTVIFHTTWSWVNVEARKRTRQYIRYDNDGRLRSFTEALKIQEEACREAASLDAVI